jgi:hypothetical protein
MVQEGEAVARALADLRDFRLQGKTPWPDAAAEADWARLGRRVLNLGRVPPSTRRIAHELGFRDVDAGQPNYSAHAWYLTGKPRFAVRVKHPCRVVNGDELLPLFLRGVAREELTCASSCCPAPVVCGGRMPGELEPDAYEALGVSIRPRSTVEGLCIEPRSPARNTLLARQGWSSEHSIVNPASCIMQAWRENTAAR